MSLNPLKSLSLSLVLHVFFFFLVLIQFSIKCVGNGSLSRSIIRMNLLAFSKKKKKKNLSAELNKLVINILFLLQNVHYNSCLFYSFLFNPKKKKKKTHTIIILL